MNDQNSLDTAAIPESPFEQIKRIDPDGNEFWSARDLMPILEYVSWQKFKNVLLKAQIACENSGYDQDDYFTSASKLVMIGSDAKREIEDLHLSRYACYLVVQNADPSKPIVALGQTYFAVQTLRQEVINHGYRGLYNGLTAEDIHKRKKLRKSQNILDHMGSLELAANFFRSAQAEEKLRTQNIQGKENANRVHHEAGLVVRRAPRIWEHHARKLANSRKYQKARKSAEKATDKTQRYRSAIRAGTLMFTLIVEPERQDAVRRRLERNRPI